MFLRQQGNRREFGDAERLAMEFETALGRSKLHEFLRRHIRDADFSPAVIHQHLLRLPWRDIFTTNLDTPWSAHVGR